MDLHFSAYDDDMPSMKMVHFKSASGSVQFGMVALNRHRIHKGRRQQAISEDVPADKSVTSDLRAALYSCLKLQNSEHSLIKNVK